MGRLRAAGRLAQRAKRRGGSNVPGVFPGRGGVRQAGAPSDEAVIAEAEQTMRGMTGNAGQDAILDEAMPNFIAWAEQALEAPLVADQFPEVLQLREDKYDGTDDIWEAGYNIIRSGSAYHDSGDEQGEGTGTEF